MGIRILCYWALFNLMGIWSLFEQALLAYGPSRFVYLMLPNRPNYGPSFLFYFFIFSEFTFGDKRARKAILVTNHGFFFCFLSFLPSVCLFLKEKKILGNLIASMTLFYRIMEVRNFKHEDSWSFNSCFLQAFIWSGCYQMKERIWTK